MADTEALEYLIDRRDEAYLAMLEINSALSEIRRETVQIQLDVAGLWDPDGDPPGPLDGPTELVEALAVAEREYTEACEQVKAAIVQLAYDRVTERRKARSAQLVTAGG